MSRTVLFGASLQINCANAYYVTDLEKPHALDLIAERESLDNISGKTISYIKNIHAASTPGVHFNILNRPCDDLGEKIKNVLLKTTKKLKRLHLGVLRFTFGYSD